MIKIYSVPEDDSKKAKIRCWLKNRKVDAQVFWAENKEEIIALAPVVIGGITILCKTVGKNNAIRAEKLLKERKIYDPRMGHYYEMRRKPTDLQWTEIDRRFRAGEGYGDILRSMGLLKK